jgi:hypothetical protein
MQDAADLQTYARLADASRPNERHKAPSLEEIAYFGNRSNATDQLPGWRWENALGSSCHQRGTMINAGRGIAYDTLAGVKLSSKAMGRSYANVCSEMLRKCSPLHSGFDPVVPLLIGLEPKLCGEAHKMRKSTSATGRRVLSGELERRGLLLPQDLILEVEQKILDLRRADRKVSFSAFAEVALRSLLAAPDIAATLSTHGACARRPNIQREQHR